MSIIDEPNGDPAADPVYDVPVSEQQTSVPSLSTLRWPVVQALRELGRAASDAEITEYVADALSLTQQQRTEMIPSRQETKLRNRIGWAVHELKEIDAVHYPEPAYRALTTLGSEVDEEQIQELRTEFEANKRRNQPGETALSPVEDKHHEPEGRPVAVDVKNMIERFLNDTDYPTEGDKEQKRLRNVWAEKLAPESIAFLSRSDLRAITNNALRSGDYVRQVEGGAKWLSGLDDVEYSRLLDNIKYLCWGEGDLSVRFDRLAVWGGYNRVTGTKGFAGWNTSAILAVCHPERFIPTKAQRGKYGRLRMLTALGLPIPHNCSTFAQEVVAANDRLREHLSPYFDDDPHAIAAFLYWILARDDNSQESETEEYKPDLAELAARLLVSPGFLKDIVSLLEDKGQVILYGPPGTGKTYLARELARTLASDESCRALVQFHPSTSYEDFFEGYRPAGTGDDGTIRFELTPGPLARMAAQASEAPDRQHVMIIDEINRGNLPRVLGELLFLLEYRNESVQTLYRPEEPFALPENLWFIGTMNTADRSIALVDAALRRRFHFVPFFPDREPMAGLLGRWLERQDEPAWVGHLVDAVNDELKTELEGSHLLLGPSHFMKEYGDSPDEQHEQLRRIWEYNIEPFIEDQFFGAPDRIEYFRFNAVMKRHGPPVQREADPDDDPSNSEGSQTSAGSDQPPDSSKQSNDIWTNRARSFPPQDRTENETYRLEMNKVIMRYVEFALERGADPGSHDDQLVDEFLAPHEYSESTKTSYRRHLREWFKIDHNGDV